MGDDRKHRMCASCLRLKSSRYGLGTLGPIRRVETPVRSLEERF